MSKIKIYNKTIKNSEALEMILSPDTPESEDLGNQNFLDLYQSAMDLYGLIHARFILSAKGLQMMKEKFLKNVFGACPRILCDRQLVLPIGMSEDLSISRVKVYCPKCQEVYIPRMRFVDVDGAYFGSSFPHIFLQTFPELRPSVSAIKYVPKIYGFKIYGKKGSKYEKLVQMEKEKKEKKESEKSGSYVKMKSKK